MTQILTALISNYLTTAFVIGLVVALVRVARHPDLVGLILAIWHAGCLRRENDTTDVSPSQTARPGRPGSDQLSPNRSAITDII